MADKNLVFTIGADDSEVKEKLDGVEDAADDTGKSLEDLGDSAKETGKDFGTTEVAIGSLVANGLTSLINKLGETVSNLFALADSTREYREDMAKLDSAFSTAGHSSEAANKAYSDFYKILGESDRSVEAVNHLAELTKNEEELAQWSTICAGVTAKFGDSLPIEGLTEAANETAKVGAVTGPLADALNWAGVSEDEFNKKLEACNSEQERASLITNTLNGLYEDEAAKYNELTASTQEAREATNNMEKAQAALGAAIEPLTTAWTNLKAQGLQWITDEGLPALQTGWQWLLDNLPAVGAIIVGLTTAWLTFGGAQKIVDGWNKIIAISQAALNAVMNANPIGLIVMAIAALVAAFLILWNNCEGFRNFWINLWENIKETCSVIAEWFKETWTTVLEWFKNAVASIKEFFSKAWAAIKNVFSNSVIGQYFNLIWETIKGIFSAVKSVLSGNFSEAWVKIKAVFAGWSDFFTGLLSKITSIFRNIKAKFLEVGSNIIAGIKEGISKAWSNLKEWFSGLFDDLIGIAKKILGIKSPSRVFRDEIGKMIVAGIEVGIEDNKDMPINAMGRVFDEMQKLLDKRAKEQIKTVADYNAEYRNENIEHAKELEKLEKEKNKELIKLDEKLAESKKQKNADKIKLDKEYAENVEALNEKYNTSVENQNKKHADNIAKIEEQIRDTVDGKMQNLISLEKTYKENVAKIWEDLDKEITSLQDNYANTLKSRTESIANSLNLFNEATKNTVSGSELKKNLKSQVDVLEDYNGAIAKLEERNVNEGFLNYLKGLGVGSAGEIEALSKMNDTSLASYIELWEKKNELAKAAATEELEPLKAETEAKVEELVDNALDKYAELRKEFTEQSALLMSELQQAIIDAEDAGYDEVLSYVEDYEEAGGSLMDGVIEGIVDRSPAVTQAVTSAVRRAIEAAKAEAGIHSPSDVTKDEIGANLALGVGEGWKEKLQGLKSSLSSSLSDTLASLRATVAAENGRFATSPGVADTGFNDLARAVGVQTAGINSLAGAYKSGSGNNRPVILQLNGRELGRAIVDVGGAEESRRGVKLSTGGAY